VLWRATESPGGRTGVAYDLLVGADGMSSTVRDALASRPGCNFKQEWLSSCSKFVAVPAADLGAFDVEALHLFPRAGVKLEPKPEPAAAVVPAPSEMLSVSSRGPLALVSTALSSPRETLHAVGAAASALVAAADVVVSAMPIATGAIVSVSWSTDAPPVDLAQLDSPQEAQRWMQRYCPALAPAFTDAVAATFAAQRHSYARAISMNKYFDSVTRAVVLMGDAAHAAAPAAGQSAAAALGDAVLLAQLLHTNADVRAAAEAYNAAAVPQGHAVVQLSSALPMLMPLSFVPLLRVVDRGREALCDKLASSQRVVAAPPAPGAWTAPLLSRSVLELLFDSEEPFTDVLRRHRPYVAAMMFVNRFRDGAIF
jgi:2-polyprenyl-6-methoxyphenol hydroxylase-like FAD-dependent oxidoreductase